MKKLKTLTVSKDIELKATVGTPLGRVIAYMQSLPYSQTELARETLMSRYLPFVIDKTDENHIHIVLTCALECESWARAIREYYGLPPASIYSEVSGVQSYPLVSPAPLVKEISSSVEANELSTIKPDQEASIETSELSAIEPEENELDKFKQELQEIVARASGADEARKKLVQMQPEEEEDWTEDQWDLWDEYCNEQEDIIHKRLFGELSEQLRGGIHE